MGKQLSESEIKAIKGSKDSVIKSGQTVNK